MSVSVGLEVGSSTVRVAVLERVRAGSVALLKAYEAPCETSSPDILTRTLLQIRRTVGIATPVMLGLPSTSAILSTLHPLIVNPRRTETAVAFELQQHLPFALTEAAWHYQWLQSNGHAQTNRVTSVRVPPAAALPPQPGDAVVAAMKRTLLEERLGSCRRAGISVQAVTINALALLNTLLAVATQKSGRSVALLSLTDASSAEWIVHTPSWFQVLPVSSAEANGLADAVVASWEALRGQVPQLSETVWIVAPSALASEYERIISARLQLQSSRLDWSSLVKVKGEAGRLEAPERMGTAIGLALQGLSSVRLPVNLLAAAAHRERSRQLRQIAALTGNACVVAALGLGVNTMLEVRRRQANALQVIERRERVYQTLRPDIRALLQRQQHLEERTQQLEGLVREAPLLGRVLSDTAQALPDGVWLGKADFSKHEQVDGTVEGRAKSFQDITQLLDQLKTLAKMTMVKPLSTNVTTDAVSGKDIVAFSIQVQQPLHAASAPTENPQ